MKYKIFFLLIILVTSAFVFGFQPQSQYARRIFPVFQDPSLPCSEGSVFYNLTSHKFLICKNTGIEEVGGAIGNGITGLNGQGQISQTLATGTAGTNFNISSAGGVHTFNIPNASNINRGLLTPVDWSTFNSKQPALGFVPENISNKGVSNGYADLDSLGKIPLARISEVLGVIDLTDYSTISGTGTTAIKSTVTSPATNQVLAWNGTNWVNSNQLIQSIFSRTGNVTAQTGDYTAAQVTNAFDLTTSNSATEITTPSTPPSGFGKIWFDSTDEILKVRDDDGLISSTIRPTACSGTDKVSAITAAGIVICTPDQSGGGGGGGNVASLNGLTASDQNLVSVNDTNVTLGINSVTATHTFTLGWTGTLSKARQNTATVYNDQANTFGAFLQQFRAGANFELLDPTDTTKVLRFALGNIPTATTRIVTVPSTDSVTVVPDAGTTSNFLTGISSTGVITKAQPAFSNLAGSATDAQIPDSLSLTTIPNQLSNGFVKTIGSNGTIFIDTTTYLSSIANNSINGAMIALGSDAQGDIMFYNGTDWTRLPAGTSGQVLQTQGTGASPIWSSAGSGDVTLSGIQTFTGAHTFNATKLIIGTSSSAPSVVANSFYRDTSDGKLYVGAADGSFWHEIMEAGVSILNLASAVTGTLDEINGGTGNTSYTKGDILVATNSTTLTKLPVGTDGQCLKADSTTTTGLIWGSCATGGGGGGSDFATDTYTETPAGVTLASHIPELGGAITKHPGAAYVSTATINEATDTVFPAGTTAYYYAGTPTSADYYVQADVIAVSITSINAAICGHMDTTADTMVCVRINNGTSWDLREINAATGSTLATSTTSLPTTGQTKTIRLNFSVGGTKASVNVDGVEVIPATTISVTSAGKVGLRFSGGAGPSSGFHFDNFSAR